MPYFTYPLIYEDKGEVPLENTERKIIILENNQGDRRLPGGFEKIFGFDMNGNNLPE